jgi:PIN domain nuclease of toxin-antitoxin system
VTRAIVDTHAALSLLTDDAPVGPAATAVIEDPDVDVLLSAVVAWEVAIRRRLGKLECPEGFAAVLLGAGAQALPITIEHAERVEHLPDHHRDPFDRLLIAQAQCERVPIITKDPAIAMYDVATIW